MKFFQFVLIWLLVFSTAMGVLAKPAKKPAKPAKVSPHIRSKIDPSDVQKLVTDITHMISANIRRKEEEYSGAPTKYSLDTKELLYDFISEFGSAIHVKEPNLAAMRVYTFSAGQMNIYLHYYDDTGQYIFNPGDIHIECSISPKSDADFAFSTGDWLRQFWGAASRPIFRVDQYTDAHGIPLPGVLSLALGPNEGAEGRCCLTNAPTAQLLWSVIPERNYITTSSKIETKLDTATGSIKKVTVQVYEFHGNAVDGMELDTTPPSSISLSFADKHNRIGLTFTNIGELPSKSK